MAPTQAMRVAGDGPRRRKHVPGQLIVRLKPSAVRQIVAMSLQATTPRALMAAMPDEVRGPIDFLHDKLGLQSMKPLFVVDGGDAPARPQAMALAAVHRAMARSATAAPREALAGFQIVQVKDRKMDEGVLKRLRASRAVDLVEPVPNRWLSAAADPMKIRQWGLRAIRWFDRPRPGAGRVHVAVLDSGVDARHPDLAETIEEYRHDGNVARDFLGHGTHVSGTIAAVVNNSAGIAGVANCRLHCWKVFDDPKRPGDDENFNFEFYSKALAAALDSSIKVINLSIGGEDHSKAEATIFAELIDAGVVISTAMGNEFEDGNPKEYPAGYADTIGVGAVDESHRRASFSNTGKHIKLVAPGVNILSTVPRVKASFADHTSYDSWPGTSMATPHVTGAAALVYINRPKSRAAGLAVARRLIATATKLPAMRGRDFTQEYGAGLLDVAAALGRAKTGRKIGRKTGKKTAKARKGRK
ncbi:S8 family serine peptidase [Bradyrhizobium sp. Bra64]|uniref:S8 family peptidase n=1 Tax=Bradyrhizobium sp. Bra64 TaxID=2926009 RepID=UPI002117EB4C|nr:S8 family serine peptidase [Bradyrhizobium sp. Bra64]